MRHEPGPTPVSRELRATSTSDGKTVQPETLKEQARNIHEEARMVLPGIQALFGFQLIAAFNQRFTELDAMDARVYLASLLVVALVTGLIMTPAAYHRICEPREVSEYFAVLSSRLIAAAMVMLALAIGFDVYVVARMVLGGPALPVLLAVGTSSVLWLLWLAYPVWHRARLRRRSK